MSNRRNKSSSNPGRKKSHVSRSRAIFLRHERFFKARRRILSRESVFIKRQQLELESEPPSPQVDRKSERLKVRSRDLRVGLERLGR